MTRSGFKSSDLIRFLAFSCSAFVSGLRHLKVWTCWNPIRTHDLRRRSPLSASLSSTGPSTLDFADPVSDGPCLIPPDLSNTSANLATSSQYDCTNGMELGR